MVNVALLNSTGFPATPTYILKLIVDTNEWSVPLKWVRHLDDFQMSTLISAFQMRTPSIIWSVFITSF